MTSQLRSRIEECIAAFRRGDLKESDLLSLVELAQRERRQDLLYLQAGSTSPASGILGMLLVANGEIVEPDPSEWQYRTVLDAIRDGWRVIQFPNQALMLDESRTYGLGCEFVLEKWR
jgi:hypothetical protein